MRHLIIAIASVVAVVQGLAGRTRGVPLAQKPTLFSRGSYFARRAREDERRKAEALVVQTARMDDPKLWELRWADRHGAWVQRGLDLVGIAQRVCGAVLGALVGLELRSSRVVCGCYD